MAKADSPVDDDKDKSKTGVEDDESQDETEEVENTEDESTEEETDETNEDSEDSDSEDDSEETDDDEDSDTSFKKRFTQLKGSNETEYIGSLEDAYQHSSTEAVRLKHELDAEKAKNDKITALLAQNPELAEKLEGTADDVTLNPALLRAEEQLQREMQTEYDDFMDNHPDVATDQAMQKKMLDYMTVYSDTVRRQLRRQPSMKEALQAAYTALGGDNSKEEALRMKAKDTAASGKNAKTTVKKQKKQTEYTDAQINLALKMGIGKTREEVIKKFRQYAK